MYGKLWKIDRANEDRSACKEWLEMERYSGVCRANERADGVGGKGTTSRIEAPINLITKERTEHQRPLEREETQAEGKLGNSNVVGRRAGVPEGEKSYRA